VYAYMLRGVSLVYRLLAIITTTVVILALSACTTTPTASPGSASAVTLGDLTITDPWVRAASASATTNSMSSDSHNSSSMSMSMGATSAGYMMIRSSSAEPDFLIAAAVTDLAEAVELHTSTTENGVMQMRQVERIEIPAQGGVELKPGGFHIMLIGLKRDLKPDEMVRLTLTFERSGTVEVPAVVRKP